MQALGHAALISALAYAMAAHRGQVRTGTEIPYITHPVAVATLVIEQGASLEEALAALLHDTVEDCGGAPVLEDLQRWFGDRVAAIVAACTDSLQVPRPPWRERKEQFIAGIADKSPPALLVSLADKVVNSEAIRDDLSTHGDALWTRFSAGKSGVLWYYNALLSAYRARLNDVQDPILPGLVARLAAAVAEIERPVW